LVALHADVLELRLAERARPPVLLGKTPARRTKALVADLTEQRLLLKRPGVSLLQRVARSQHQVEGEAGDIHPGKEHHDHKDGEDLETNVPCAVADIAVDPDDDAEPQEECPNSNYETAEDCVLHLVSAFCSNE
jgi:hypothetical protein